MANSNSNKQEMKILQMLTNNEEGLKPSESSLGDSLAFSEALA